VLSRVKHAELTYLVPSLGRGLTGASIAGSAITERVRASKWNALPQLCVNSEKEQLAGGGNP